MSGMSTQQEMEKQLSGILQDIPSGSTGRAVTPEHSGQDRQRNTYEPGYSKIDLRTFVNRTAPDQPAHSRSLI